MYKTKIVWIQDLETYLNKPGFSFLCNYWEQFIFKYNDSPKSNELLKDKTLYDLIKTLNIEDFREYWDDEYLKETMKEFVLYRRSKNDWWIKELWQMQKVFDVWARFRTFLKNWKQFNNKKWLWITEI